MFQGRTTLDGWTRDVWTCKLTRDGKSFSFPYKCGLGHKGQPPTLDSVLFSLATDAQAYTKTFLAFCSSFGYASDSIKAHNTWIACKNTRINMLKLFTQEEIDAFPVD